MAARPTKIVVPIGAMDRIGAVEIHHPRNVGLHIARAGHGLRNEFVEDAEAADHRWCPCGPAGNRGAKDLHVAFVGNQDLLGEVNINPLGPANWLWRSRDGRW